jgi:Squalene-hopene cyclase C-terminal domain
VAPAGASDSDMTGVGLQALAAIGRSTGGPARRAVTWLRDAQQSDGGWGVSKTADSNSQSTAYAVTGLIAVGAGDGVVKRGLAYLRARQRGDGSVAYSASSTQTPVWVTAQALLAFRRAPFPLDPVPRKKRAAQQRDAVAAAPAPSPTSGKKPGVAHAEPDTESVATPAPRREEPVPAPDPRRSASLQLDEEESGPSAWLVAFAAAAAVGLVLLLRRRLRLRRGPAQ